MKFIVLIYTDETKLNTLPPGQFDEMMRHCLDHADELREQGRLSDSQMLQAPATARSIRVRNGRQTVVDGPFTETKEVLGGFNLIDAPNMEEAVRIASQFPWAQVGCLEVRPVQDIGAVRQRVSKAS
jgi:hypothetical protein